MTCTVNIIGAGLSGLSCALSLAEQGIASRLISQMPSERAQSVLAEGGINAALDVMGEGDSVQQHAGDTLRGGCDLADPSAVGQMTAAAPEIVRGLQQLGVPFAMEQGQIVQRFFGGQKKRRTAFAQSSTGKALMTALIDAVRRYEAQGLIERMDHHAFLRLLTAEGRCAGAVLRDSFRQEVFLVSGPVVLCFGGPCGLFAGQCTGTTTNDASALAAVFAQGIPLSNLEMIQYHPTTAAVPGKRLLISEAARAEGGRLYVMRQGSPWYFMEEFHPLGNLAPRDVVSRRMWEVVRCADCEPQVFLDLRGLSDECWKRRLPDLRRELQEYLGLDPAREPVPVSPGIHYFMGGIAVDRNHRTRMPGLWAAGECACIYHGANRLGGNSLLGAVYGGQKAAEDVRRYLLRTSVEKESGGVPLQDAAGFTRTEDSEPRPSVSGRISAVLTGSMGIVRTEASLEEARAALQTMREEDLLPSERQMLTLALAVLASALSRRETRGAHVRSDFPKRRDDCFSGETEAVLSEGEICVSLRSIPKDEEPW